VRREVGHHAHDLVPALELQGWALILQPD
jgi:hypothetical protein